MSTADYAAIGARIARHRTEQGMTRADVVKAAEHDRITTDTFGRIERGARATTLDEYQAVADVLDVGLIELLLDEPYQAPDTWDTEGYPQVAAADLVPGDIVQFPYRPGILARAKVKDMYANGALRIVDFAGDDGRVTSVPFIPEFTFDAIVAAPRPELGEPAGYLAEVELRADDHVAPGARAIHIGRGELGWVIPAGNGREYLIYAVWDELVDRVERVVSEGRDEWPMT